MEKSTGGAEELTVYHYKTPLLAVPEGKGFGYYGALSITKDGDKAQCHRCGQLFRDVGLHARQKHTLPHAEYREEYQLARKTSLISETLKEERKEHTILAMRAMSPAARAAMIRSRIRGYKEWRATLGARAFPFTIRLETKNKRGTCPDQILAKILECATALGHTPDRKEFIEYCGSQRYIWLMKKTFGSWTEALRRVKLVPRIQQDQTGTRKPRKTNDELLDMLSLFYQENNRIPTEADSRRGWIPDIQIYTRRFGSIKRARELAGLPDVYRTGPRGIATL